MPAAATVLQTSANIPLSEIRESPHNHRKYFDEAKLQELADSMKAHGVLQPVLVRPLAAQGKVAGKAKYELVYGHRRFRAAKLAGLKALPAAVRELDDKAALEVALIENCRRADVLPMEEAEGYRELHQVHGVSVEQLAERVGKSKEYVYGRLKLCELKPPAVRKALEAGKVSPSVALLIARIPGERLQEQAAKKILEGGAWDEESCKAGPMSYRAAQELVEEEFTFLLSKAPFNTKDAALVPEAGACGPCPKRTGNCKALFPDVKSENVCTDPECFGRKKAAAFKREKQDAAEKGQKLLKESKTLWDWEGKKLGYKGQEKYVELTDKVPGDKKGRTFKEVLKKSGATAQVLLARDPNGKVHQLLEKEKLAAVLEEAGVKVTVPKKGDGDSYARRYEKQRQEEEFRQRVVERGLAAAGAKVASGEVEEEAALRLLTSHLLQTSGRDDGAPERQARYGLDKGLENAQRWALLAFCLEVLFLEELGQVWNGYRNGTKELLAQFGLKLEDLEKQQKEADAASPAKASPTAGAEALDEEGE